MARSRADGLSEALRSLEKIHGRITLARGSPMDLVVGLLLSRGASEEQAADGLKRLLTEFVDWNEVRISYCREVSAVLAAAGYPDAKERAETILALLGGLYRDKNGVDLAFLERMESPAVYDYFRAYPQVGEAVAATLTASLREDGMILDAPEILRTAQRIGIGGARSSPARVRKVLEETLAGADRLKVHYYFMLHATAGPCRARSPQCATCDVSAACAHGRSAAKSAGRSAKSGKERPGATKEKEPLAKSPEVKKPPRAKSPGTKKSPRKKPESVKKGPRATVTAVKKTAVTKPSAEVRNDAGRSGSRLPATKKARPASRRKV
jgi:endonuclease III